MTMSYITGSHFKPGYGGFAGQSENLRAFQATQRQENILDKDRIKFFKDAHFDHCDRKQPMMSFTSMGTSFDPKDLSGKKTINNGNNAFSLRHHVHNHGKIGQQNTNYVTDSQTRYRWIQPQQTDNGVTASMGQIQKKK